MSSVVADTHAALWYLQDSKRLSVPAATALQSAVRTAAVYVSSVTFSEIVYLVERRRIPPGSFEDLLDTTRRNTGFVEAPFTSAIADAMRRIPRSQVPDMPDRMIAATALALGLPLVTADARLHGGPVPTIW